MKAKTTDYNHILPSTHFMKLQLELRHGSHNPSFGINPLMISLKQLDIYNETCL